MAASTAKALVRAEAQGLASHGRADGSALARVTRHQGAAVLVDAGQGLAFPACDLAVAAAIATARWV